jgi:hypothetical protein
MEKKLFCNLAKIQNPFLITFLKLLKQQDDLSSIEGRSIAAKFALPLIKSISNETKTSIYK